MQRLVATCLLLLTVALAGCGTTTHNTQLEDAKYYNSKYDQEPGTMPPGMREEINNYMEENNCTFEKAYWAVMFSEGE